MMKRIPKQETEDVGISLKSVNLNFFSKSQFPPLLNRIIESMTSVFM
jgi:hypothetical protein